MASLCSRRPSTSSLLASERNDDEISHGVWRTTKLCTSCRSLQLASLWDSDVAVVWKRDLAKDATCPFCLVLISVLVGTEAYLIERPLVEVTMRSVDEAWDRSRKFISLELSTPPHSDRKMLIRSIGDDQPQSMLTYRSIDRSKIFCY
jgi:hypothetical protein